MMTEADVQFSVTGMVELFENCAKSSDNEEVNMKCYLDSWHELIRFLNSMGKAFAFIASDVGEKCKILKDYLTKTPEGYKTIESMVLFEKEKDLIQFKGQAKKLEPSGSRTLLRLHRALIFLKIFFDKISENRDENKISQLCYDAYHESPMSKFHPWYIRKAVGVAVFVLPNRSNFMTQICGPDLTVDQVYQLLHDCSASMGSIYDKTEKIYQKYNLGELP